MMWTALSYPLSAAFICKVTWHVSLRRSLHLSYRACTHVRVTHVSLRLSYRAYNPRWFPYTASVRPTGLAWVKSGWAMLDTWMGPQSHSCGRGVRCGSSTLGDPSYTVTVRVCGAVWHGCARTARAVALTARHPTTRGIPLCV